MSRLAPWLSICALTALPLAPAAQTFVLNTADVPGGTSNNSSTENVDFGDVDLDGDWDAAFADGGDSGNDQNRLWINQGGLQLGVLGVFEDRTAQRFPSVLDDSRDIEFCDYDGDQDLDTFTSNTAQLVNQGNRFWTNQGGAQGGSLGFFTDETSLRWVGLGGPGSSIPPSLVLPGNTFIDWSCDSDFADLDNDGDPDLVQSSYGGAFSGNVPDRIFLNDGDGYFEEFNPSGYQLSFSTLPSGSPGLWCQGTHVNNTTDTTGTECDITSAGQDVEFADVDGDFDLDFVKNSQSSSQARLYANRLSEESALGFRDVSHALFPPGALVGTSSYELEFGDIDNDGDIDLVGLNWQSFSFAEQSDALLENQGDGTFALHILPESDENAAEGDWVDVDNDGDLDLAVSDYGFNNSQLYRNDLDLGTPFVFTRITATDLPPPSPGIGYDFDAADLDGDGDYDLMEAKNPNAANLYMENVSQIPDVWAPRITAIESVSGHAAAAQDDVVRAHVYDNAPSYVTYFNPTSLVATVDGLSLPSFPMQASGGQVFRGELPGNLVGQVEYAAVSSDEFGNAGTSVTRSYANTGPTGTPQGGASSGPLGVPLLRSLVAPLAGEFFALAATGATPGSAGLFLFSFGQIGGGVDLGDGAILNVAPPLVVNPIAVVADATGTLTLAIPAAPPVLAGATLHAQVLVLDGIGGATWSSTQGLGLAFP